MPGIYGIVSVEKIKHRIDISDSFYKEPSVNYLREYYGKFPNATFGRFSVNKFQNDKIFERIGNILICTDGIILNLKSLLQKYKVKGLGELIVKLYNEHGYKFINILRGNFVVSLYFHKENKLILFTDHLAAKPIYYFYDKNSHALIFASDLKVATKNMKQFGFLPHLDIRGAYCLLTFGYMLGDITLIEEIKKIPPGNVLIYENGAIKLEEYYRLSNKPYIKTDEEESIRELDRLFKEAVKVEYEKDLEYGYKHIATLSGGLDSRTNIGYAKKIGFNNITCFTFSQSGYLDEKIAKKICSDNHLEFVFYALDNGDYLINYMDNIVNSNDGLVLYSGSAHFYNCIRKLSFQDYGLIHTGMIGDGVLGSLLGSPKHDNHTYLGEYSDKLMKKINPCAQEEFAKYSDIELFKFYNRCINGAFNGYRMAEQFTEFSSPFLYIDFLDYALKINPKYRHKESIYLKWINKYLPEFTNYKWEKCGITPKYPILILNIFVNFRKMMGKYFNEKYSSMNPMEYWWRKNITLQKQICSVFKKNIRNLKNYPGLLDDSNYLFKEGTLLEKTQVLTLLKAIDVLDLKDK